MHIFTPPSNFSKVSRRLLSLLIVLILQTSFALAQDAPFITVWKTDNPGTSEDNQITIPGTGTDYLIEWEEVGNETNNNGSETGTDTHTITFPGAGTYRVKISGDFRRINLYGYNNESDNEKIIDIEQWGDITWSTFSNAFFGCKNLVHSAIDAPDLTNVTNMGGMFFGATLFNGEIGNWDVSNIENMSALFSGANNFNQDITNWDVSNVYGMASMFHLSYAFNQDISGWDVSNVVSMRGMFFQADAFNHYLGNWDVSNVEDMSEMFYGANSFNQFLQVWDVSKVKDMSEMFYQANDFDQNLSAWNISNVLNMQDIFKSSNISNSNYDKILTGWSSQAIIPENIDLGTVPATFCGAIDARSKLVNDFGWSINGDKYCLEDYFVTRWDTNLAGESNTNQIIIPGNGTDYLIEWEQIGNLANSGSELGTDFHTLTLPNPGEYRIKISGDFRSIRFANSGDKNKLLSVDSWGNIEWETMESSFYGCQNLEINANNAPNLTSVTDLSFAFKETPIKGKSLSLWNTSSAVEMESMFASASQFNVNLNNWDVSSVTTFTNMLNGASTFNQNLASWNPVSASNMQGMLDNSDLSTRNYVQTLNEWSSISNIPTNITIGVAGLTYCFKQGRDLLINSKNWTFSGDNKDCSNQFVSIWKTDNNGITNDNQIQIPGVFNGYNTSYLIEWEEVGNETEINGTAVGVQFTTITFPSAGTYRIKISGDFAGIAFNNSRDKNKIVEISQWGDMAWKSYRSAFYGCTNLTLTATDVPDLSKVSNLSEMFRGTTSFNGEIGDWDVSQITDMDFMFYDAVSFNKDISSWNVSNVKYMSGMFLGANSFNIDIGNWNVINVTNMRSMFSGASSFNQNLNNWKVSNVTNMYAMFRGATAFNGNIGDWDVSNVTDFGNMFKDAVAFNQSLNNWDLQNGFDINSMFEGATSFNGDIRNMNVSNSLNMSKMFSDASSFNQDLTNWNVSNATDMSGMFNRATSFNGNISNWDVSKVTRMQHTFSGASSFNQDLNGWDVSNVIAMNGMFSNATLFDGLIRDWNVINVETFNNMFHKAINFNQDIKNWDVSNATNLSSMFNGATAFSQDISAWNVSNNIDFSTMFAGATNFNQDLSAWDVSKGENFTSMFAVSAYQHSLADWSIESATNLHNIFPRTYSRKNYQATLNGWAQQANVPSNVEMRAYEMEYCIGSGRDFLINSKNWTITDDRYFCGEPFTVVFNTENPGISAANEVELPISGGPFYLEWEDVNDSSNTGSEITSGAKTLAFPHSGVFRVKITGDLEQIKFADKGDKLKLIALESWGDIYWQSLDSAFMGCANMLYEATDYPDLSSVKNLNYLFAGASKFDAYIGRWDLRFIEEMVGMLDGTAMSENNYESTLERWFNSFKCPTDITIGAERVKYCVSLGRDSLKQVKNWTFTGDQESCGESFITTWDTRNTIDGSTTTLFLPIRNNIDEFFRVHWEEIDNTTNSGDTIFKYNDPILIFDSPGVYKVSIVGKTNRVRFTTEGNSEKNKLISIDQWGDTKWEALAFAFKDCDSLKYNATDAPDLNKVTTLESMFEDTHLFNGNINNWDVSSVTNMDHMFQNAKSFNQDLDTWDVSHVTSMVEIFSGAASFNGKISTWNVSNITSFEKLFFEATSFNQSLSNWDISNAIDMNGLFENTALNQVNYESTLNGWAALTNVPDSIFLNSKGLIHCNSTARSFLIDQKGWNIIRDINICSDPFITIWKTDNQGSSDNNQIQFPGSGNYYSIEWEELDNPSNNGLISTIGNSVISFPNPGKYILSVRGDLKSINFQSYNNDQTKLVEIKQWGDIAWNSFENAFYQCDSLTYSAIDTPDLSNVTDLSNMFSNAYSFNGEVDNWDVSNVTDMSNMFRNARSFNQSLGNWDISNVSDMSRMFEYSDLDTYNYDKTLISWSELENLSSNVNLGASNMKYCLSEAAREKLINEKGWSITGDTKDCQATFISTWKTDNDGSSENNQISIPGIGTEYIVHWEEVENIENSGQERANNTHTLTFPQAGTYRIKIYGDFTSINFSDLGDKSKILDIENWGDIQWTSMNTAFAGAENLTISANDAPDLSQVTDMTRMFYNAKSLNQDISHWDVSNVTNMSDLFHGASSFNQDLSNWDVSNVTKMTRIFANTAAFNQGLNSWNTSNVEEMDFMFWDADAFNGNISDWNTSNVTNMWGMFYGADSFNIDISTWDVSAVTNMTEMFRETSSFNQDLNNWNVSNVTEMSGMFYEATAFDQNLGDWNLSNAGSLFEFLTNSGLSVQNYDLSLEGWATNGNIPSDIALSVKGLYYCASAEYRQQLIDDFGWNIMGDQTCSLAMEETFPAAEATSVEKDTEIYLTFDQEIEEIDLSGITLKDISGNTISISDIYIDNLSLHLVHNGLGSNTYEVIIPESSIISITGKKNEAISWSFATQRILSSNQEQKQFTHTTYPNPFSDFTTIQFNFPQTQSVNLLVFDLKGQVVRKEQYDNLGSEKQSIKFKRKELPAGLYRYQLQSAGGSVGGKMLVK